MKRVIDNILFLLAGMGVVFALIVGAWLLIDPVSFDWGIAWMLLLFLAIAFVPALGMLYVEERMNKP